MIKYGLVKRFEKKQIWSGVPESLDSVLSHPNRYRISAVQVTKRNGVIHCREKGREGSFPFPDHFCPEYLGEYPAVFLQYISEEEYQQFQKDKFIEYNV
jgi:hypothetical protein